ncbi:MAG: hypothetical protein COU33_00590 [Candidatus Magasanikbacteria bacterium CG10_big_fil_rev_8_21_14_0_10_43_6]|uniref:Uncharacterized protein n=1 Tax=Candidatus Magasanikbacteria bacterium CG10_big_fil_rev_8_21_14_0_10_43_6 TaxID=1974650 RepID=A0A2M6W292_9BACT|nr:MAG: hypothetical protein COU33_00590 [Candidatus Magasanikbacteria bacterium CG10_big_fil_rev_8_21_14_0_10_43_6]
MFSAPLQEFKPFDFYHFTILAFALAFGIERVYLLAYKKYPTVDWRIVAGTVGLTFLSVHMIFGNFIDDPAVQERRIKSRSLRRPVAELVAFLEKNNGTFPGPRTVGPGAGEIHGFVPLNMYIYFNQHNNHPATRFSEKKVLLEILSKETDPAVFYQMAKGIHFGPVDRFVLFKRGEEDNLYSAHVHIDDFPRGAKDEWIDFDAAVFADETYATKVFENDGFIVFDLK